MADHSSGWERFLLGCFFGWATSLLLFVMVVLGR